MDVFGVFAKFWAPGQVKTRLASTVGTEAAAKIYLLFLEATLAHVEREKQSLSNQPEAADIRTVIGYSPLDQQQAFAKLAPHWELYPQSDGDLGERMSDFFEANLANKSSGRNGLASSDRPNNQLDLNRTLLIGSDTPLLKKGTLSAALQRLEKAEVVLGPSVDGGYYLIGCRSFHPELFKNIAWSTSNVLEQTIEILRKNQISFELLEAQNDVDDWMDLQQLFLDLQSAHPIHCPKLISLQDQIRMQLVHHPS